MEGEMRKTQHSYAKSTDAPATDGSTVSTHLLPRLSESWFIYGNIGRHSERTIESRRECMSRLVWFLHFREYEY
jgi:hypothetical protein